MNREDGSLSAELVLVTPVLVMLLLFVVFAGRLGQAAADVRQAAATAAREASLHAAPDAAAAAARLMAEENLTASGVDCAAVDVDVNTSTFVPSGTVGVTVRCRIDLADITFTGIPGTRVLSAEAVEVLDTYRAGSG